MLWFAVWFVLVVGTLVGAFFLARSLWRSAKALLAELERLGDVLDRLAERADALAATAGTTPAPVVLDDPAPARARLAAAQLARAARRARRAERHEAAYRRWWSFVR